MQDIAFQLQRFVTAFSRYHTDCRQVLEPTRNLFPIEVDLSQVAVKYNTTGRLPDADDDDEPDSYDSGAASGQRQRDAESGVDALTLVNLSGGSEDIPILDLNDSVTPKKRTDGDGDLLVDF